MEQGLGPIYDVVASLKGTATPERSVLLGTHHDAWTFGGVDPGTGTTAMLEVAKGLGALAKSGWRPARTISLAFWDAEELGWWAPPSMRRSSASNCRNSSSCT